MPSEKAAVVGSVEGVLSTGQGAGPAGPLLKLSYKTRELSLKIACNLLNFLGAEVVERKGNWDRKLASNPETVVLRCEDSVTLVEHIPLGRSKWPRLSCTWCLPLAHKHSMVSLGDLIFMAWATGHPSQSDLVWESWKCDSLSKYHLRVSKSYNNEDSITLENQGGRITWKQNTQTGPKGRPSTTKDNFLWDSDPRAHSSEAA